MVYYRSNDDLEKVITSLLSKFHKICSCNTISNFWYSENHLGISIFLSCTVHIEFVHCFLYFHFLNIKWTERRSEGLRLLEGAKEGPCALGALYALRVAHGRTAKTGQTFPLLLFCDMIPAI